jgi:hypothetical protein
VLTGTGSGEVFLMRFSLKRSGDVGDPYRGLKRLGEVDTRASDNVLLLHFETTGSGLLRAS